MPSPELYLFDTGTVVVQGALAQVPFFLIRHPDGDVIVDGGNPLALARDPRAHLGGLADVFEIRMSERQHCAAQLAELGVGADQIDFVVQTHLHFDHTGALGHFPQATVVVHERELEAARYSESPARSGYIPADYEREELRWRTVDGDTDLFGDGTVRLLETPGHTAGHMSVLLVLEETGAVLLTADACDNRDQWEGRAYTRALFNREQAAASLERLHRLADETRALVVFGHDPKNWSELKRAPRSYR
jgi:glyoxylase-like metal-dependent hydrolase (beta-lactamase superfamily II)